MICVLLTETCIRELFAAGFIPGMLGVVFYMLAVRYVVWRNPKAGPPGELMSWKERWQALRQVQGIVFLFALVMGGIYGGIFTPTEAAGIGAGGAFVIALPRKSLTWRFLFELISDSTRTTAMLLLTVPVFFPLVQSLGFDLVWFGIVVVVVTEISLITPPVGMNVFVLSAILKDINTGVIFRGVTPFWCADLVRLLLITLVAQISLFLPQLLYG